VEQKVTWLGVEDDGKGAVNRGHLWVE
jgi:hypothetical protein